jgi:prevent-host-death family protein
MKTVNIGEAKAHFSRLVEGAARGEPFIIAKNGKPMVKVVPLDAPVNKKVRRTGFLAGQLKVPDDFNTMCREEIEEMFYGDE